ncbi:MAG TPA: hypothetical protein VMU04_24790 [Candidatus Acidoferrum sp.]|nr:hypothetical protein [Candidatus Acidoferrum sp.]
MTKTQERRAVRKVNAAARALILAESELMETPLRRSAEIPAHCLGPVLDAAHSAVEWATTPVATPAELLASAAVKLYRKPSDLSPLAVITLEEKDALDDLAAGGTAALSDPSRSDRSV